MSGRLVQDLLRLLDLGDSAAETDAALERAFVTTEPFRRLVRGDVDIVVGDKGMGKTALYRILLDRSHAIPELKGIDLVSGFNPAGSPVFHQLTEGAPLLEGQYATIWKAYFISLVGNWLLTIYEGSPSPLMSELDALLRRIGLRTESTSPVKLFTHLVRLVRRLSNPKSIEATITLSEQGMPIVVPRLEFSDLGSPPNDPVVVPHDQAFELLERTLAQENLVVWVLMDRLDEAFAGFPAAEIPALRALLRTYLDLLAYDRLQLKLFLRTDLVNRVTAGGFVNLDHVNPRRVDLIWDDEDLRDLLYRRFVENDDFMALLGGGRWADDVLGSVFPRMVEEGPTPSMRWWPWALTAIRDGNGSRPPRNLIDLVKMAQLAQLREERRAPRQVEEGEALIGSDALKRGLTALSKQRVRDRLFAEAGPFAAVLERFEGAKSDYTAVALARQLDMKGQENVQARRALQDLGFLEQVGTRWVVPLLYRDGMRLKPSPLLGEEIA
jgi:hypothetical protein